MQHLPVRLGVLGAARIALGDIIPAATRTGKVEIGAVGTRGVKKLLKIREAAPEADLFEDYDSLLEKPDVEAV